MVWLVVLGGFGDGAAGRRGVFWAVEAVVVPAAAEAEDGHGEAG